MGALRRALAACLATVALAGHAAQAPAGPTLDEWKSNKTAEQAEADAAAKKDAKMAAVNKVVTLLQHLLEQVSGEGEKEAATYNKFACFCKDMTAEKTAAITAGEDSKSALSASIEELTTRRLGLDASIADLEKAIADENAAMQAAQAARDEEMALYQKNEADLRGAVEAITSAIQAVKASKSPALLQLTALAPAVREALFTADALGIGGSATATLASFLQQQPAVPTENYSFHSDKIVETLEQLLVDFKTQKTTVDADEVKAVSKHELFMQEKTDLVKSKGRELEEANKNKAQAQSEIASNSQQLTTVAATLVDDQEYLQGLSNMCAAKAKTWDQRSQVRSDELSALTAAMAVIKDTVGNKTSAATVRLAQRAVSVRRAEAVARDERAMEAVEAATETDEADGRGVWRFVQLKSLRSASSAFLARARRHVSEQAPIAFGEQGRQAALAVLRSRSLQLKSAALATLVAELAADPLAQVKQLIQELLERLLKEANNEENQKGWCDRSTSEAEQKRGYAAEAVTTLNGEMAQLEALRDKLEHSLAVLAKEITDLEAAQASAVALRTKEKAENEATVAEAKEGLTAVKQAVDILEKFYKTAAKATVALQTGARQGPAQDAPDAGFGDDEAYKGAQGASGGVLGLLDVISSDFQRTVSATEQAEAQAEQDHLQFMTDSGKSLAEKQSAKTEETRQKDDAEDKLAADVESLKSQTDLVNSAVEELLQLKQACVDTGMSYEERVARRQDEIAALKKAACIFENFAQYGPKASDTGC